MQFPGTRVQFSQSNLGSILNLGIIFPTLSMHDIIGRDGCDDIYLTKGSLDIVWLQDLEMRMNI